MIKQLPPLTLHDIYTELNSIRRTCTSGHPNIVQVHSDWIEAGRDGIPTAHVVMELCTMNYAEYLKNLKINPPGYWWFGRPEGVDMRLELEILRGLAYIHNLNEIHRDLKPQNSMSLFKIILKISTTAKNNASPIRTMQNHRLRVYCSWRVKPALHINETTKYRSILFPRITFQMRFLFEIRYLGNGMYPF